MIYNDYRTYILTCEYLGKEPIGQYKEVYDFLTDLWDGMEIVVDSLSNQIVLQTGGQWFFEQHFENGYLWCQHECVWTFFRTDMGMEIPDIEDFIKSVVEEHLKCEVGTPTGAGSFCARLVEEHLKCVVGTPDFSYFLTMS